MRLSISSDVEYYRYVDKGEANGIELDRSRRSSDITNNKSTPRRSSSLSNGANINGQSSLPQGSITFQRVLDDIRKEKEAEQAAIEKTLKAFVTKKKRPSVSNSTVVRGRGWRMASLRIMDRRTSSPRTSVVNAV